MTGKQTTENGYGNGNGNGKKDWLSVIQKSMYILFAMAGLIGYGYVTTYRVAQNEKDIARLEERFQKMESTLSDIKTDVAVIRARIELRSKGE